MNTFVHAFVVFLPAGIANMTPLLANKVPGLNRWETPMDFGCSFGGIRIFGAHKTWRGIITATACGTLAGLVIAHTLLRSDSSMPWLPYFAAMSFGALAGDAIKSFFKRRVGIASGKSWVPFDQIDYIIGALVCTLPFGLPKLSFVLSVLLLYFVLHLAVTYIGYLLHFKKDPI
jgi:CDP-2,3-bis-(O-geranylgeranyl)-sn-glycerol synthase